MGSAAIKHEVSFSSRTGCDSVRVGVVARPPMESQVIPTGLQGTHKVSQGTTEASVPTKQTAKQGPPGPQDINGVHCSLLEVPRKKQTPPLLWEAAPILFALITLITNGNSRVGRR